MHLILQKVRELWVQAGASPYDDSEYRRPNATYYLVELADDVAQLEFDYCIPLRLVTNKYCNDVNGFMQSMGNCEKFKKLIEEKFDIEVFRPFRRVHLDTLNESGPALRIKLKINNPQ